MTSSLADFGYFLVTHAWTPGINVDYVDPIGVRCLHVDALTPLRWSTQSSVRVESLSFGLDGSVHVYILENSLFGVSTDPLLEIGFVVPFTTTPPPPPSGVYTIPCTGLTVTWQRGRTDFPGAIRWLRQGNLSDGLLLTI